VKNQRLGERHGAAGRTGKDVARWLVFSALGLLVAGLAAGCSGGTNALSTGATTTTTATHVTSPATNAPSSSLPVVASYLMGGSQGTWTSDGPEIRPSTLPDSPDGGVVIADIHWTEWSHEQATGSGLMESPDCYPGCTGNGNAGSGGAKATLVLSDPTDGAFSKLTFTFPPGTEGVQIPTNELPDGSLVSTIPIPTPANPTGD